MHLNGKNTYNIAEMLVLYVFFMPKSSLRTYNGGVFALLYVS